MYMYTTQQLVLYNSYSARPVGKHQDRHILPSWSALWAISPNSPDHRNQPRVIEGATPSSPLAG